MTRIFKQDENIFNAADSVRRVGYAAIEGTKSSAEPYCNRVIEALSAYDDIDAIKSYLNVKKQGYLYFVYDARKLTLDEVRPRIELVDFRSAP